MIVLVAGTGTDVGKTWFGARTIETLRACGVKVAARKLAQSFDPSDPHPTDAEVLGAASGEPPEVVCPPHRWYELPMAPPMASEALGRAPFTIAELVAELAVSIDSGSSTVTFVETAGGVRSPLAHDGDAVDLCAALRPDLVVLVADSGLGTINAVRLGAAALHEYRLVIALNRFDPADDLHRANRDWLQTRDGLGIVTDPEAVVGEIRRRVGS